MIKDIVIVMIGIATIAVTAAYIWLCEKTKIVLAQEENIKEISNSTESKKVLKVEDNCERYKSLYRPRQQFNNWRKMHGLPMRRKG